MRRKGSRISCVCIRKQANSKRPSGVGFTLIELLIVVTIIGLTATFSFKAWSAHSVKVEFDSAVNEIVAVFQEARAYAMKNVQIGESSEENSVYRVEFEEASGEISLSGDVSGEIFHYDWNDVLEFDSANWSVTYTAPYADFATDTSADLEFTLTSTRSDLSETIIVRASSGIAEIVR